MKNWDERDSVYVLRENEILVELFIRYAIKCCCDKRVICIQSQWVNRECCGAELIVGQLEPEVYFVWC